MVFFHLFIFIQSKGNNLQMCSLFFLALASTFGLFLGYLCISLFRKPQPEEPNNKDHQGQHEKESLSHKILKQLRFLLKRQPSARQYETFESSLVTKAKKCNDCETTKLQCQINTVIQTQSSFYQIKVDQCPSETKE